MGANINENLAITIHNLFEGLCDSCAVRIKKRVNNIKNEFKKKIKNESDNDLKYKLKNKLKEKLESICSTYMLSRITNNQKDSTRNPYLITIGAMLGNDNEENGNSYLGICKALNFKNPLEVLLGDKKEQSYTIYEYFHIIRKCYLEDLKDNEILNNALSKHIILTYYLTFYNNNIIPEEYAPLNLKPLSNNTELNYNYFKTKAIESMYDDIEEDFAKIFYEFAGKSFEEQSKFFQKLCNHTQDIFIEKYLMNLLKEKYSNPSPISLHLKNTINDSIKTFNSISKNVNESAKRELLITTISSINKYTYELDYMEFKRFYPDMIELYTPFIWSFQHYNKEI